MFAAAGESERLVRDVLLRDGSTLRLQAPTPADFDDIKEFFDGLSAESGYLRFHGYGRTDIAAREAAGGGGVDRVALIARYGGRVVAVAGFDGLREPRAAEVAFAVADDFRGRGAGTRMLEQLAAIAADRGINRFDAEVMSTNGAMLGVFEGAGFAVRRRSWLGELTVSLEITPSEAVLERIDERDHFAAVASLRALLAPSSIAVVGAAATPGNVGRAVLANIVAGDFQGPATPVNRAGGVVCSRRAARSLAELEIAAELVIIAAAGDEVLEFAAEAAANGARALLVLPTGLEDDGVASLERHERLLEIVRDSGLRIVGPGSVGVVNTAAEVSLNATFTGARVRAGTLAIGAQAVAPGLGLLGHAEARQMGISILVSVGGRADVSANDLLEWCEADDRTAVVMLYVESFGNPERFTRVARRVSRRKPILVVKGRRSAERARSQLRSHTAAAALRGDAVIDAVLHQAGVLRFHSSEELFHVAQLFESQPLPSGRRIAIASNSASVATLASDACAARGLEARDARGAPYPVLLGLGAGAHEYAARVRELLGVAGIDALVVCYVDRPEGDPEGILEAVSAVSEGQPKPVVASVVRSDGRLPASSGQGVPNYLFPELCVAVLARAVERRGWLSRPLGVRPHYPDLDGTAARALIASFLDREPAGGWLSLREAEVLLATHGIPFAASHPCPDLERALALAAEIGGPVAMKADFAAPAHASDIDAVLLGLKDKSAVRSGWRELERRVHAAGREWTGANLQRLVARGADMLVGAFSDPDLGSVIAVGLGGRQAGLGETVACRLPPATDVEADELIDSCDGVAIELDGFRGAAALDREALRELILRFALLLGAIPELVEADLNPVRCTTNGCVVLDMRVRIERRRPLKRVKTW
jgi:acyl-CoA synthetase (NDP forming)/RimJ/RimL family protein N-acetyltransferase